MSEEGTFWVDEEAEELVLKDKNNEEQRFYIDEEINMDGNKYLILVPSVNDDDNEALALKLVNEEDNEVLTIIEDDKEFDRVKEKYRSM